MKVLNKTLQEFAVKNKLVVRTVKYISQGQPVRRLGYDLCKPNGEILASFEPKSYSNGVKWFIKDAVLPEFLNKPFHYHAKRITRDQLEMLDLNGRSYSYNSQQLKAYKEKQKV